MSIPELTIPIELPIDIPVLLHPAIVHFVIAIPVVIILLEFINLFFKKRALSLFSLFLILIVATVMAGAYFTGVTDGKEAFSLLSEAGKAELKEHKLLGIYLVYGSLALVVLKLLFMLFKGIISRLFFVLILIGFTAVTLKQGHDGGELVYKYGANSEAIADIVSDKDDIQEELDELKEECEGKSKAEPKAEVKQEEPKQEVKAEPTPQEESSSKETNSTDSNSSN
jgi:uncharacterized membrane protein